MRVLFCLISLFLLEVVGQLPKTKEEYLAFVRNTAEFKDTSKMRQEDLAKPCPAVENDDIKKMLELAKTNPGVEVMEGLMKKAMETRKESYKTCGRVSMEPSRAFYNIVIKKNLKMVADSALPTAEKAQTSVNYRNWLKKFTRKELTDDDVSEILYIRDETKYGTRDGTTLAKLKETKLKAYNKEHKTQKAWDDLSSAEQEALLQKIIAGSGRSNKKINKMLEVKQQPSVPESSGSSSPGSEGKDSPKPEEVSSALSTPEYFSISNAALFLGVVVFSYGLLTFFFDKKNASRVNEEFLLQEL